MSEAEEVHDDGQGEELFEHHRLVADPGQTACTGACGYYAFELLFHNALENFPSVILFS